MQSFFNLPIRLEEDRQGVPPKLIHFFLKLTAADKNRNGTLPDGHGAAGLRIDNFSFVPLPCRKFPKAHNADILPFFQRIVNDVGNGIQTLHTFFLRQGRTLGGIFDQVFFIHSSSTPVNVDKNQKSYTRKTDKSGINLFFVKPACQSAAAVFSRHW